MKKKSTGFILACVLLLVPGFPALAAPDSPYVIDMQGQISANELAHLNGLAAEIDVQYGLAAVAVLAESSGGRGTIQYAKWLFRNGGYGGNGLLLLVNMEAGEWFIHAEGRAAALFEEEELDALYDRYNAEETEYGCLEAFIQAVKAHLESKGVQYIPQERRADRLVDNAVLLSSSEAVMLMERLNEISERYACDVAIVTVDSLKGKTATEYADDFFDYNGYGIGENDDGILFLISMEDRDWAISTHSFAIAAFTDAGQAHIMDRVLPSLRDNEFFEAFSRFSGLADDFLVQARSGTPYDTGSLPKIEMDAEERAILITVSVLLALLLAFIPMAVIKATHRSVRLKSHADTYIREGSFRVTSGNEIFLFRQVTKTKRESKSAGGGGGSRTHTSSSGRTHGGSRGKF